MLDIKVDVANDHTWEVAEIEITMEIMKESSRYTDLIFYIRKQCSTDLTKSNQIYHVEYEIHGPKCCKFSLESLYSPVLFSPLFFVVFGLYSPSNSTKA